MSKDLPPEAYTRETLQEAFNWLQDQPEPVRATIHTPERLVSLYRKSQRLNDQDAPVSSKKFIDDLKDLATSLNQFSTSSSSESQNTNPTTYDETQTSNFNKSYSTNYNKTKMAQSYDNQNTIGNNQAPENQSYVETQSKKVSIEMTQETKQSSTSGTLNLDTVTMERMQKVKNRFNLSSDTEALRLLVSLGFEKFSQF